MLSRLRPVRHRPKRRQASTTGTLSAVVAYNDHGGFCVPVSARRRPAAQAILKGRIWEPATLTVLLDACREGDVIHAGAFFGDALPALSRATPGLVWAFEPSVENHRCAEITCQLNGLDNVRLFNAALSAAPASGLLETAGPSGVALGGASHLVGTATGTTQPATLMALDDIFPTHRNLALLHLDVEGHESQAVMGAISTIKRCRPVLVLETLLGGVPATLMAEHLVPLGYQITEKLDENTVLRPSLPKQAALADI